MSENQDNEPTLNTVTLLGRVSAVPEARELPSGDQLVTFRVVVDRPPDRGSTRRQVDVIDVACWSRRVQRTALSLGPEDTVRVEGALRRRFFAAGAGRTSRYEVEAQRVARVSRRKGTTAAPKPSP
jgi:single-strand DNA-binding protein